MQDGFTARPTSKHERSRSRGQTRLRSRSTHNRTPSRKQSVPSSFQYHPEKRPSTASSKSVPSLQTAAWFQALPSTIQRKHFSPAEQYFLSSRSDNIILDAADEAFLKRGRHSSRLPRSPSISPTGLPPLPVQSVPEQPVKDWKTSISMDEKMHDEFRWLNEEEELDLRLDDYHTIIKETSQLASAEPTRRPSFRQHLSLSSLPFRRSASIRSSQPPPLSPQAPSQQSRPISTFFSPARHRNNRSVSSIDPRASHYQDPAARLKLRVYLASPQKFDEALEFGFPSSQDRLRHARPKTSPRLTQESGRTFYSDDTPSLSIDGDGEEREGDAEEGHDPRTPEDPVFQNTPASRKGSSDRRMTITPRVLRDPLEPYAQASATDREMTIHMTLTRPDLRAADEHVPKSINEQPLEQAELPFEEPMASIWDTLPEENSRMKRFWRRLTSR